MADCKLCATLMEERLKLTKTSTAETLNMMSYRSIVGGLRYLTHTTGHHVRGRLCEQIHGRSMGGSLGCSETAAALRQGDG
jgi:hypothetical protein